MNKIRAVKLVVLEGPQYRRKRVCFIASPESKKYVVNRERDMATGNNNTRRTRNSVNKDAFFSTVTRMPYIY